VDYVGAINPPNTPWISIGSRAFIDTNAVPPAFAVDTSAPDLAAGQIDELALWDRALSASEITGIYQAGSTNKPLTAVVETPPSTITPAILTTKLAAGNLTISWSPAGGRLLSASSISSNITWSVLSPTNPTVVPVTGKEQFFRVVKPVTAR